MQKVDLVSGASSEIGAGGARGARHPASLGASVSMVGRNEKQGNTVLEMRQGTV